MRRLLARCGAKQRDGNVPRRGKMKKKVKGQSLYDFYRQGVLATTVLIATKIVQLLDKVDMTTVR